MSYPVNVLCALIVVILGILVIGSMFYIAADLVNTRELARWRSTNEYCKICRFFRNDYNTIGQMEKAANKEYPKESPPQALRLFYERELKKVLEKEVFPFVDLFCKAMTKTNCEDNKTKVKDVTNEHND